jgi:hypothetical protein
MMKFLAAIPGLLYLVVGCLVVGLVGGVLLDRWWTTPKTLTVTLPGNTTVVTVDKPVIQTRDVVKVVTDKAEAQRLMAEAVELKYRITVLTETLARTETGGSGTVEYRDRLVPGPATEKDLHFSDWRLTFDAADAKATYSLSQKFESLTAVGKDKNGQPTATTRMFEVGPGDIRTPLSHATTTVVAALPDAPRWHLRASVTAGAGYVNDLKGMTPGGMVGLRWLSHGSTAAAEDSRWAVATPALWVGGKLTQVGILPVSVNLAFPGNPFRDLWLSPFIGFQPTPAGLGKVGFVLHATF